MTALATGFWAGTSLFSGWFPTTVEVATVVALVVAVLRRRRRWWLAGVPAASAVGCAVAAAAHWYMDDEGLSGDPAPTRLWVRVGVLGAAVVVLLVGWWRARWWQRVASALTVPLAVLCVGLVVNQWVGYYSTVEAAYQGLTQEELPGAITQAQALALRGTTQAQGRWVAVSIPSTASGFSTAPSTSTFRRPGSGGRRTCRS